MLEKTYRVLVIDDDARLIHVLTEGLQLFGAFEVLSANDGAQGLEKCMTEHPDVAIVDVRMPHLNGYQLIRALRGDASTSDIPLIMLSAMVEEKDQLMGILSGADVYLEKPVLPQQLVAAIHHTIFLTQEQRAERLQQLAEE